jgi:acyl-coenzyme A thioesterase PaaI-like protein
LSLTEDNPPEGFLRVDFDRGRPETTFNSHVGNIYCRRGARGTRDEFVLGIRVAQHMCNPAGGLHGGMMMLIADLVGTMGGGALAGLRKFLPTVSVTCDFVAPARLGDWVEGRPELVRQTRSLLFTNIYLTVGEEKILRASAIAKIPSGDGLAFGRARLDRGAEVAAKSPPA